MYDLFRLLSCVMLSPPIPNFVTNIILNLSKVVRAGKVY